MDQPVGEGESSRNPGPLVRSIKRSPLHVEDSAERSSTDRDHLVTTLRAHEGELHAIGVSQLYLFGSVARGDAGPDSDVDLFFDTDDPRFSLIELVDVQDRINAILGVKSDVMTRASLHPMLRPQIEAEALRVF